MPEGFQIDLRHRHFTEQDLEEPRIKAEVKHRAKSPMGSQDIRSFLGWLREEGDIGHSTSVPAGLIRKKPWSGIRYGFTSIWNFDIKWSVVVFNQTNLHGNMGMNPSGLLF